MDQITANDDNLKGYREIFSEDADKAAAFDRIAEACFARNFGRLSKTDFETLLFDIYLSQLEKHVSTDDYKRYSDYQLSKELGITQSKVSNLKVRRQLQYQPAIDWKESLVQISKHARYEGEKFKLQIPDINVYYEIKNAIEETGGFVEVTLTPRLLQVSPEYFINLLVEVADDDADRKTIRKELRKALEEKNVDTEYLNEESLQKKMKKLPAATAELVLKAAISGITEYISPGKKVAKIAANILNCMVEEA